MNTLTTAPQAKPSRSLKQLFDKGANGLLWIVVTFYGILTLYPLYWLVTSAFKTNKEFFSQPFSLPEKWQWVNFSHIWQSTNIGIAFMNSFIVSIVSLIITLFVSGLASFILARFHFRLKTAIMALFIVGLLIPIHSTLVPLFILMKQISLLNTYWALILPYTAFALPTAIFVLTAYLATFPKDIEEAAFIDGTGLWGVFLKIILPMSMPALSTVTILTFLHSWNDFSFALVFVSKATLKTLPLAIANFADGYQTDYGLTLAAMTLAIVPTIVVYLVFQEHVMKGMTAGAVKG
jgi:raffinose/stachyose/melibiose transport system permease protein